MVMVMVVIVVNSGWPLSTDLTINMMSQLFYSNWTEQATGPVKRGGAV